MKTNLTAETLTRKFKKDELDLANLLYPKSGYTLTEEFSRQDIINEKKKHIVELKIRNFTYEYFISSRNGSFLIEKEKYDALIYAASELGFKPIYVFGFRKNKDSPIEAYSALDLSDMDFSKLSVKKVNCPRTEWNPVYEPKDCYFIPSKWLNNQNSHTKYFR